MFVITVWDSGTVTIRQEACPRGGLLVSPMEVGHNANSSPEPGFERNSALFDEGVAQISEKAFPGEAGDALPKGREGG